MQHVETGVKPYPKIVLDVIKHFGECYVAHDRCLHCNDCIAFALIYSETMQVRMPPPGVPYSVGLGHEWNFVKFLGSTIAKEYLPCPHALSYEKVKRFAWSLLRLSRGERARLRECLLCHSEFKEPAYSDSVEVFVMSKEKFEEYRRYG